METQSLPKLSREDIEKLRHILIRTAQISFLCALCVAVGYLAMGLFPDKRSQAIAPVAVSWSPPAQYTLASTNEDARVLIVCVELCTLHFISKNNNDNILANTIFGDGAAAVLVVPDNYPEENYSGGIALNGFYSLLLEKGKGLMSWNITPVNFEMVLDSAIPVLIGEEVSEIIAKAKIKLGQGSKNIDKWAIHPGGKKILDNIKKQLNLKDTDLQYSYKVLKEYGNMSSPTILFVLKEIFQAQHQPDETIFALGFGPGLNIETAIFTYA